MKIIKITANDNGAHANQTFHGVIPEGWALLPSGLGELENFPFGSVTVETLGGVPTVTAWEPGTIPTVEAVEAEPTEADDTAAMLIDHEYRLTMLELGLAE